MFQFFRGTFYLRMPTITNETHTVCMSLQYAYHFLRCLFWSVDFGCRYEPTLKLYAKHTCESVVVVFPFVQRRSAPSAKNLFVLCCAALALACLSRKHMAPHMWRCQGGLSERSSSFWCLQLTTNPDSESAIPLLATTLASRVHATQFASFIW